MMRYVGNDLGFMRDVMAWLEDGGVECWLFGGWAEELRGLSARRAHSDVDLLYPSVGFAPVDRAIRVWRLEEIAAKRLEHKRAFVLDGTMVEIALVRQDARGHFTSLWGHARHDWPNDVFSSLHGLRVASSAALHGYRAGYDALHGTRSIAASVSGASREC